MITLTINDSEVSVEPGTTIISAAEKAGIVIPHYCWHPALSIAGSCRLCLVEIEGAPKDVIACGTPVTEGMVVRTESEKIKRDREIILEFLLLNHPLDCPVCDKAGECQLQDYSFEYGTSRSRFKEEKRVPPFKDLGPNIMLATTRCILCTRCTRFMDEIGGDAQLTVMSRGSHSEIGVPEGQKLEHPLAGNVVDICPVGALLDKNFIHRTRVWNLSRTPSVCGECSAGCNTYVDSSLDKIFRIIPRTNEEVNGHWICDTGRYGNKAYEDIDRLTIPKVKEEQTLKNISWNEAVKTASDGLRKYQKTKNSVAGLISPGALIEDAFAVKEFLSTAVNSSEISGLFYKPDKEDKSFRGGFIIKGDSTPNQEGLQLVFGMDKPDINGGSIMSRIKSGNIKALYVVHNDLSEISQSILDVLAKLPFLIVEDIVLSPVAKLADVVLPGATYFEKTGTFINYQRRLQLLQQSVNAPEGVKNTWDIVKRLASMQNHHLKWNSYGDVFMQMAKSYPELKGLTHFKIGASGALLKAVLQTAGSSP